MPRFIDNILFAAWFLSDAQKTVMGLELNSKHPAQSFSVGSDSLLDAVIERV